MQGADETVHGFFRAIIPEVHAGEGRAGIPIWLLAIIVVAVLLLALWAGQGVDAIRDIASAGELVARLWKECLDA